MSFAGMYISYARNTWMLLDVSGKAMSFPYVCSIESI